MSDFVIWGKKRTLNWFMLTPWEKSESHYVVTNCCLQDHCRRHAIMGHRNVPRSSSEDPMFCCLLQHVWLGSVSRESPHLTDICARAVFPSHMIMKCDPAWPMRCWGYLRRSLGHPAFNRTEKTEAWNKRLFSKQKPGWWWSQITNPRLKRLTTDQPRIWTVCTVQDTKVSPGAVGVIRSPTCCSNIGDAYF